ncbi:MAG TPA: ABC transporter ATP-binding protein [Allosphingosinicella sp.]|jgi:ABC-type multidrug transport system fused ATPase/permease subunit
MSAAPPPERSTLATLKALLRILSGGRRRDIVRTAAMTLLGTFSELLTIGSVVPFLAIVSNPEAARSFPGVGAVIGLIGADSERELLIAATGLLIAATLFAAMVRLLILWSTQRTVVGLGHEISTTIYSRMLRQPYIHFLGSNPSEHYASVDKVQALTFSVFMPMIQGLNASVIAIGIGLLLVAIDPLTALLGAGVTAGVYVLVTLFARRRLKANSAILARQQTARMQAIQEAVGGIRDILLGHTQNAFEESFRAVDLRLRRATAANIFIAQAPRFLVEAVGIVLIGLLALAMSQRPGGIMAAVPVLGALALGAQRLFPLLQQAYSGWSVFAGNTQVLVDVVALLEAPVVEAAGAPLDGPVRPFERDIVFDRVGMSYPNRPAVLQDVRLTIAKGERIGLVGTTGSGKSSFLDVLMALIDPDRGEVRIDGVPLGDATRANWQAQIAHVPQAVYLSDSSIAANIAFGAPQAAIDMARIEAAARQAQMHEFILTLPQGYATPVGERGVRLSGGQRQRIAIARALYKDATLLIFDEATAALDRKTEAAIMDSVKALGRDRTILIVAHRISALDGCDRIVRIEAGRIVESGAYGELVGDSA